MRPSTISKLLLLLSFVFFSTAVPSYAQLESETVHGRLRNISPRLLNGSPYQRVEFMGEAGQQLTIDVSSSDFDAYIILKDSNDNVIAEDNNSGSNRRDAYLTVTIPSDGRYEVWVTTYQSSGRGRYTITISELDPTVLSDTPARQEAEVSSSSTCDDAISQMQRSLKGERQISVTYQGTHNADPNHPEGRPLNYHFRISPYAGGHSDANALMSSPQLLASLTGPLLEGCSSAATAVIGLDGTDWGVVYGEVNGRVVAFSCAENIGIYIDDSRQLPWGYMYCQHGPSR